MVKHTLFTSLALAAVGAVTLGGCGKQGSPVAGLDSTTAAIQDSTASDAATNQSMDAANQSLVDDATSSTPGDNPSTSSFSGTIPSNSGPLDTVNLRILATPVTKVVNIAALVDSAGSPRYPNLSGSFTVTADGTVVNSWPTASNSMGHHMVTVTFDQGPVVYSDPNSGATATVSAGSYTYTLDSNATRTAVRNWTLDLDAALTVPAGSPIVFSVARAGAAGHSVSFFGNRHVLTHLTRVDNTGTGGLTNTLTVDRTVDGGTGGTAGVDTANPLQTYTNWVFTINASASTVTWNRFFHANITWNFIGAATRTINAVTEHIYVTRDGTKHGPYTSLELAAAFHAKSHD